jgi:hypothetical protein
VVWPQGGAAAPPALVERQHAVQDRSSAPLGSRLDAPARGHAILLGWEINPWPVDAGVPAELAGLIATAFTELGEVAFRWAGPPALRQARDFAAAVVVRSGTMISLPDRPLSTSGENS